MATTPSASLFDLVDWVRDLINSQAWASVIADLSKNDFLALLFVYRKQDATMSEIADYLGVPPNTVTGVANRLQKRGLVERTHSEQDKRVVTITVSETGIDTVSSVIRQLSSYEAALLGELTNEEIRVLTGVASKVVRILQEQPATPTPRPTAVRRIPID